jgi:predicted nucleic acid-binding protein
VNYFFWDASALGKHYNPEKGSDLVNHLWNQVTPDQMLCLGLGYGECVSILVRSHNAGRITMAARNQALANLRNEVVNSTMQVIPSPNDLTLRATSLIVRHSINATDAIVLRAALDWAGLLRGASNGLVLVASDQRLLRAAQTEGLQTFNPETDTQAQLDSLIAAP